MRLVRDLKTIFLFDTPIAGSRQKLHTVDKLVLHTRAGKNLGFLEKVFRFFRFQCTNKTGHKISTQEEHPIGLHNSLSFRAFFVKYNTTHKSRLKYEI